MYTKLILGFIGLFIIYLSYSHYKELVEDLSTKSKQITSLNIQVESSESLNTSLIKSLDDSQLRNIKLSENIEYWRGKATESLEKLAKHDFKTLVELKPGLVERIINRATIKSFREIELLNNSTVVVIDTALIK